MSEDRLIAAADLALRAAAEMLRQLGDWRAAEAIEVMREGLNRDAG